MNTLSKKIRMSLSKKRKRFQIFAFSITIKQNSAINYPMIQINNLYFSYADHDFSMDIPYFHIEKGGSVAITGPSGSGKTTLLNLICGVLRPLDGEVIVDGISIEDLSDKALRQYRIAHIGMVFQSFELLEYLNVLDNILLPYRLDKNLILDPKVKRRAYEIAESFGIEDKLNRYPSALSQGEKQRVAIARALITGAKLIIADEPTGNLDPKNTEQVADILLEYVKKEKATLVTVTHDHAFAKQFDRVVDFTKLAEGEENE